MNPCIGFRSFIGSALSVIVFFLMGCQGDPAEHLKPLKPIQVATGNWEPYIGEKLSNFGPMAEMVSTILADNGYVPEFKFYSWPMAETHLKTGYPFIALPFIRTAEREEMFKFSNPIGDFEYVLFYHKSREKEAEEIFSLADLKKNRAKIGRVRGYAKMPGLESEEGTDGKTQLFIEVASTIDGFNQLRDGKIDYLLEGKIVGLDLLEGEQLIDDRNDFFYLGQPDETGQSKPSDLTSRVDLHIMFSPQLDPDFIEKINDSISKHQGTTYFDTLRLKMDTPVKSMETGCLSAVAGNSIYGYATPSEEKPIFVIPRNSSILIVEWSERYSEKMTGADSNPEAGRSKVKILNGPSKGRVMWVDNHNIIIGS